MKKEKKIVLFDGWGFRWLDKITIEINVWVGDDVEFSIWHDEEKSKRTISNWELHIFVIQIQYEYV